MTYHGVDGDRLRFLLRKGLLSEELQRFFDERRRPLILKGDKQNPPRDFDEAIQRVMRFSDAAHGVLGSWLEQQDSGDVRFLNSQLVNYFRSMEICNLELPDDEVRKLARCGLLELYSKSPSNDWLEFLSTEIRAHTDQQHVGTATAPTTDISQEVTPEVARAYAEWAVGIRPASDLPDRLLRSAAELAEIARSGKRGEAAGLGLPDESWNEIARVHGEFIERKIAGERRRFTATAPPMVVRDPTLDYLAFDVVCAPARNPGLGPHFLDVLCFCTSTGPITLSESDLREVVPNEGRIILHADSRLPVPKPGVAEAYRVECFKTPRNIKVRAIGFGTRLHLAVYVPHASSRNDSVREWLRDHTQAYQGRLTIFVLADGVCIRPRGDLSLSAPGFDWAFDRWEGLAGMELTQTAYMPGPLPQPDGLYECSPASVIARRFLKSLNDRQKTKLTKQQIVDLSGLLGSTDVDMTDEHRRRIAGNLAMLVSTDAHYDELVSEVMKSTEVQQEVERRKEQAVKDADDELAKRRRLLENLKKDAHAQEAKFAKLKEETEERAKEIRASIRKAFEQAREREAEVLGQLALWQELLNPQSNERAAAGKVAEPSAANHALQVTHLGPQGERLPDVLRSVGMANDLAEAYAVALSIARDLGFPVVISGAGALHIGMRLGRAMAEKMVFAVDVGVGAIEATLLDPILTSSEYDVLVLRSANLSDMNLYGTRLIEEFMETACRPPASHPRRLTILAEASGPAALPWPIEINQLALKVDLSRAPDQSQADEVTWLRNLASPLQRKAWSRIEQEAQRRSVTDYARGVVRAMLWQVPETANTQRNS